MARKNLSTGHPPRDRQMTATKKAHGTPDPRRQTPPNIADSPYHPDPPPDFPAGRSTTDT